MYCTKEIHPQIKNEDQSKFYMVTQLRITERSRNLTIYNMKIFVSGMKNSQLKRTKKNSRINARKEHYLIGNSWPGYSLHRDNQSIVIIVKAG